MGQIKISNYTWSLILRKITMSSPYHYNAPESLPDEPPRKMIATQKEMMDAKIPLNYRDYCAHLYIPLQKCRNQEFLMAKSRWYCKEERAEWMNVKSKIITDG